MSNASEWVYGKGQLQTRYIPICGLLSWPPFYITSHPNGMEWVKWAYSYYRTHPSCWLSGLRPLHWRLTPLSKLQLLHAHSLSSKHTAHNLGMTHFTLSKIKQAFWHTIMGVLLSFFLTMVTKQHLDARCMSNSYKCPPSGLSPPPPPRRALMHSPYVVMVTLWWNPVSLQRKRCNIHARPVWCLSLLRLSGPNCFMEIDLAPEDDWLRYWLGRMRAGS